MVAVHAKRSARDPLQAGAKPVCTRVVSLLCACVVLAVCLNAPVAHARREATFNYPYSRVWTTAVRLMRVDFEAQITEKDKDDGYFLFEFPDRGKSFAGSMELIASQKDEAETVRVVLTIQALPTYVESMLMERLAKKLLQEFGPPPERKPEKRPAPDKGDGQAPDDAEPPSADADKPKTPAGKPARPGARSDSD
jgi:hypothetical protein